MITGPTSWAAATTSASIASASSARRSPGSRCFASSPRNGMTIDGTVKDTIEVSASGNAALADRLESFAALLELADAQYHAVRAYRRAAEVIRSTPAPVAELVRAGRAQELRGIGPGIEGRLRELVETGDIQELADLERELAPELIGLGRLLGIGAKRGVEVGRALGISTLDEFREAAEEGRLQNVPGIGPQTERKLVDALRAAGRPRRGSRLRGARDPVLPPGAPRAPVPRRAAAARHARRDPRRPPLPHDLVGRARERLRDGTGRARARLRVPRDLRSHTGSRR